MTKTREISDVLTGVSFTGDVTFGDNNKAIFGAGSDLQIYHDGSDSYIDNSYGNTVIDSGVHLLIRNTTGESLANFLANAGVELYYDNSKKLATTATGIDVTGTVTADGGGFTGDVTFGDSNKAIFGAGSDLQIYHTGSNSVIEDAGTGNLELQGSSWVILKGATSGQWGLATLDGAQTNLYHNGSLKLATTTTGINVSSSGDTVVRITSADGNGAFLDLGDASDPDGGRIVYDSGSNLTFSTASTERMRIDSSGNVGIGTTSPSYKLSVSGIMGLTDGISTGLLGLVGGNYYIQNTGAYSTIFQTNATERMRIDSSGRVGIGTNSPLNKLDLAEAGDTQLRITSTDGNNVRLGLNSSGTVYNWIEANGTNLLFAVGNTERMRLETDGDLHVDGNVVAYSTTISDERLKKNIQPIENALWKVNQINGCTFTYLKDDRDSAGLIAQDLEKVLPSAVIEDKAVFHGEEGETYKTIQYDQVIGLLVEAVKELTAKVERLENGSSS